jgi:hypothetical protein
MTRRQWVGRLAFLLGCAVLAGLIVAIIITQPAAPPLNR